MKKIVLGMLIFCGFINFAEAAIEHCIDEWYRECYECEDGYTLNESMSACIECNIPNCGVCSDDGQSCAYCGTNYGKDGNGGCKPCPEHCRSCDDAQVCRHCENNYILQKTALVLSEIALMYRMETANSVLRDMLSKMANVFLRQNVKVELFI